MKNFLFWGVLFYTVSFHVQSKNPFGLETTSCAAQSGSSGNCRFGYAGCAARIRLTDPVLQNLNLVKDETFYFRLNIDSLGNVTEIFNISSKTTCKDETVLNQVMEAITEQVKYAKKPEAKQELLYHTLNMKA